MVFVANDDSRSGGSTRWAKGGGGGGFVLLFPGWLLQEKPDQFEKKTLI